MWTNCRLLFEYFGVRVLVSLTLCASEWIEKFFSVSSIVLKGVFSPVSGWIHMAHTRIFNLGWWWGGNMNIFCCNSKSSVYTDKKSILTLKVLGRIGLIQSRFSHASLLMRDLHSCKHTASDANCVLSAEYKRF